MRTGIDGDVTAPGQADMYLRKHRPTVPCENCVLPLVVYGRLPMFTGALRIKEHHKRLINNQLNIDRSF
jgi:hypothetical protein